MLFDKDLKVDTNNLSPMKIQDITLAQIRKV